MYLNHTQCCAVKEIANLSGHKSPEEAMKAFCTHELLAATYPSLLYGHYTFTAVVRTSDGTKIVGGNYGPNFFKFIRENNLGGVIESEEAPNRVNHPTHFVKVYVWQPDPDKLLEWWKGSKVKKVMKPKVKRIRKKIKNG